MNFSKVFVRALCVASRPSMPRFASQAAITCRATSTQQVFKPVSSIFSRSFAVSSSNGKNQSTEDMVEVRVGTVKWFDPKKGFGFILPSGGGSDIFVHHSGIISEGFRNLEDGEEVEFEAITDSTGRPRAVNVTGPGGAPVKGGKRDFQTRQSNNSRNM